ncbi:hypothetical protein TIFTF001_021899 [Ficus carica]|uniref:Retrotransposon gag domain-containing protein n=1 Tax=Ficus carica TaxID=3494 RepID=A0AA88ADK4_FICCA|nr:hypothetical protein TIFTF001_021899 [Ficus carica]
MDEQANQDFQDLDNPDPTGSQSTRRPPRQQGARAQRKPTQTEILTENVRSPTEVVRAFVDREAHNVQFPPAQQEAAESTPSRPPRSASRPSNPSPPGDRRSNRSNREGLSNKTETNTRLDQLVGQQYGMEQVGTVDPPFAPVVMATPYPARFKMPSVTSYNGSTDADEHLENYQAHMLIQNANEAAPCKSLCLTLTRAARQWYRRLAPGSIGCFKQLADSFAAKFLGSKTGKLGASHLFGIKQGEAETLKKYLERFDKAIVQVESCTDDTLIQAFREGVKDTRLVWTLAYDKPPTFAHLRGIAWRHAEADEYVRGRGLVAREQPRLPRRKTDRNQPDQKRGRPRSRTTVWISIPVREHRPGDSNNTPRWSQPSSTSLPKCLVEDWSEIHRHSERIILGETRTNTATSTRMWATTLRTAYSFETGSSC